MDTEMKQDFDNTSETLLLEPLAFPTDAELVHCVRILARLSFEELVLRGDARKGLALRASVIACFLCHNAWCADTRRATMLRLADWAERIAQQCLTMEREPPSNSQ